VHPRDSPSDNLIGGQVRRQISARRVDGRFDISRCAIDVAAQVELQRYIAAASELDEVISVTPAM